ncbi:PadR family transcriptional regulator [Chloroflexota bacterium]
MLDRHRFLRIPWKQRLFHKGDLKYVILDLIKDKPRHGYEIIRSLEERSHGLYTPSAGAVYPTLQMLEEMGYVTAAKRDGKKVYTITAEGGRFLTERKDFTDEIKGNIKRHWNPDNIAEITKTMDEFARFRRLSGHRLRQLDKSKLQRIRKIISRAYEDIEDIMKEKKEAV